MSSRKVEVTHELNALLLQVATESTWPRSTGHRLDYKKYAHDGLYKKVAEIIALEYGEKYGEPPLGPHHREITVGPPGSGAEFTHPGFTSVEKRGVFIRFNAPKKLPEPLKLPDETPCSLKIGETRYLGEFDYDYGPANSYRSQVWIKRMGIRAEDDFKNGNPRIRIVGTFATPEAQKWLETNGVTADPALWS